MTFNLSDSVLIWVQALGCVSGVVLEKDQQWLIVSGLSYSQSQAPPGCLERSAAPSLLPPSHSFLKLRIHLLEVFCLGSPRLTITLQPLLGQAPQQGPAVLTERRAFVIVDFKSMRHVNFEPLLVELKEEETTWQ